MFDTNNVFHLDQQELIQILSLAFSRMLDRDRDLFECDSKKQVQERTFMHRFAFELHNQLHFAEDFRDSNGKPVLSIDVEYNRDGDDEKPMSLGATWGAPDILLHQRGSGKLTDGERYKNDVFVCELKKAGAVGGADSDRVQMMVRTRKYLYGISFYSMTTKPYRLELYKGEPAEVGDNGCFGPVCYRYNGHCSKVSGNEVLI